MVLHGFLLERLLSCMLFATLYLFIAMQIKLFVVVVVVVCPSIRGGYF